MCSHRIVNSVCCDETRVNVMINLVMINSSVRTRIHGAATACIDRWSWFIIQTFGVNRL
jgi:hypothetical protein